MKKLIALVMALVMALSLTTVAWGAGATYYVSSTGDDAAAGTEAAPLKTIEAALAKADVEKIVLKSAITVSGNVSVDKAVTIDANGIDDAIVVTGSLTLNEGVVATSTKDCIFKIDGGTLVVDGATVSVTDASSNYYAAVSVIGATGSMTVKNGGTVSSVKTTVAVVRNGGTLNVEDGAVYNTAAGDRVAINVRAGGIVNVTGGEVYSNTSSALRVQDGGGTINIDGGVIDSADGYVAAFADSGTIKVTDGIVNGVVDSTGGAVEVSGGYVEGVEKSYNTGSVSVTGGTFEVAPDAAYLNGLTTMLDTNGNYYVTAPVATGDKFDLYVANAGMKDALAAGAESVPALSFTNMSANTNQDGSGNLAYIAANNGQYFVKTTNPTVADYAVTVAGKTDVLYYVSVVDVADMQYYATAKAFTNFGTKCGQLYKVDTTKEYYVIEKAETGFALAKDDVSYVVKAGGVNVLVGNEIKTLAATPVDDSNTVLTIDEILGHNWAVTGVKATTTGKTVPTQVKCLNCGAVVTKFYDAATKVPAGTVATAVPGYETVTNTHDAWFFVEPAAASVGGTVVVPSTDKVESAETFDAGIAMYVGMSIMAATGAVVLKKKD